jgi:hypothetical protein
MTSDDRVEMRPPRERALADQQRADAAMRSSTSGSEATRCSVNHDMSPSTPAMKPSSGMVAEYSSLLMWVER